LKTPSSVESKVRNAAFRRALNDAKRGHGSAAGQRLLWLAAERESEALVFIDGFA
jgi:hypothetical protein